MRIVVAKGDTLWALARKHMGDPRRWPEIYRRNVVAIKNAQKRNRSKKTGPDWIFPGTVLEV